ncbi:Itaconate transport protein [Lachnellula occidentalis]|uniref:Itaconate transport protein n=1 Tax=Lachnellula occidentalis TaxID=215460 RepID=A0A8H8S7G3_9HELO|nr:Itaconate transport protein [Lachnellula occidentalis]
MELDKRSDASAISARDDGQERVETKPPGTSEAKNEDVQDLNLPLEVTSSSSPHESSPRNDTTTIESSTVLQPADPLTRQDTSASEKPYSSYTLWEKRFIVLTATMGAFFSPFTAQIYFPALNTLAKDLHVSSSKINLTMTTYMILQAIAPAFIGGFSDTAGRRPAYIICFVIYIAADIALALQNNYVALLILRMVQSGGSSGTVALANAIVADVATSAERGMYIGITSLTGILAPSLGPILGGIISQYAGWQWIFWFLAILAAVFFIPMLLFMPETCRLIVDDGTVPPPAWNRSYMNVINERKRVKAGLGQPDYSKRDELARKRGKVRFPNPLETLVVAFEKEGFCVLFYAGVVYAGFYAVISGMPSQFKDIYGFNDLKVGLMYLPMAGGSLVAAFTQGKIIDWSWFREGRRVGIKVTKSRQQDLSHFPIEKARLQVAIPMLFLACICTIIYGWILHFRVHLAGPCIILFFLGYTLIAATQTVSILIVDINPSIAGTATAAFNLIRCLLGAGATALILPMTRAMGLGWSYTLIALIYVLLSPMLFVVIRYGPRWRAERKERDEEKQRVKAEKEMAKGEKA